MLQPQTSTTIRGHLEILRKQTPIYLLLPRSSAASVHSLWPQFPIALLACHYRGAVPVRLAKGVIEYFPRHDDNKKGSIMGGKFEWIPWSDREDSFVEHAVPLGLKDGFITYIARVKRGGVVSGSDEQSFGIVMRSKGRGAEIIGADGVMEQVADYEVSINI